MKTSRVAATWDRVVTPSSPTSSASREEMETLPDVTITETGAVGDRMWKDAQERMRGEE